MGILMVLMRFAVLVFPGTWSDHDCQYVLEHELGQQADLVWHKESDLDAYDAVVIPGGFSYGDHLRCGAIARFSPVMQAVVRHAERGKPVIGICNGFQILCEAGLLPGVLQRNASLRFVCRDVWLKVERTDTIYTSRYAKGEVIRIPVAHGDGNYFADAATLDRLEAEGRVVLRYVDETGRALPEANPNGSQHNIAGICDPTRRILGLMPHPERLYEPLLGGIDGRRFFESMAATLAA